METLVSAFAILQILKKYLHTLVTIGNNCNHNTPSDDGQFLYPRILLSKKDKDTIRQYINDKDVVLEAGHRTIVNNSLPKQEVEKIEQKHQKILENKLDNILCNMFPKTSSPPKPPPNPQFDKLKASVNELLEYKAFRDFAKKLKKFDRVDLNNDKETFDALKKEYDDIVYEHSMKTEYQKFIESILDQ